MRNPRAEWLEEGRGQYSSVLIGSRRCWRSGAGPEERWHNEAGDRLKENDVAQLMSKSELIEKLTGHSNGVSKKNVKEILDGLAAIAYKELKKSGAFLVPGLAKFVVIKKPATKAREGINPFTKEPTIFKAKPARKIIRARPVKAAKDAVA